MVPGPGLAESNTHTHTLHKHVCTYTHTQYYEIYFNIIFRSRPKFTCLEVSKITFLQISNFFHACYKLYPNSL